MASTPSVNNSPNFKELFWRFTLRHLQDEPARFILTIAGIALGIALMVAIQLSNEAALSTSAQARRRQQPLPLPWSGFPDQRSSSSMG